MGWKRRRPAEVKLRLMKQMTEPEDGEVLECVASPSSLMSEFELPSPETADDPLLATGDVAAMLDVHKDTVRRWIKERRLKVEHAGRHYRVRRSVVEAFAKRK